mgnify:FL=1
MMTEKKYIYLYFAILFFAIFIPFFISYGGIVADTLSYIKIADSIPDVKSNLFPLGYPLIIRLFHSFTDDYYFSARIVSILTVLLIGVFSYFKKFYFKETIILLCTKIFVFCIYNLISEGLFLGIFYFLIYYFHEFFSKNKKGWSFILPTSLLFLALFLTRYSGIFIYAAILIFFLINYRKPTFKNYKKDFFFVIILSGFFIASYMLYNFLNFGGIMGENERFSVDKSSIGLDIIRNFLGVMNLANPILGIKPAHFTPITIIIEFFLFFINLIFIYLIYHLFKKNKAWKSDFTITFLLISSATYLVLVIISKFFQGIEELNTRMLSESSFPLFLSAIILYFQSDYNKKIIFYLAVFSLLFNAAYLIKIPQNFLKRKAEVENQLVNLKDKKYYFDNIKKVEKSRKEYKIPIINKTFYYEHGNQQKPFIDGNIIISRKPEINLLLKDTVKNKKSVIFSSDIK